MTDITSQSLKLIYLLVRFLEETRLRRSSIEFLID